jgi:hypothetical protein
VLPLEIVPLVFSISIYAVPPIPLLLPDGFTSPASKSNRQISSGALPKRLRMNGLLPLLFFSFLPQGEVLPPSIGGGPPSAPSTLNMPNAQAPFPAAAPNGPGAKTSVGWGQDSDGAFCMIIQIAPEAIALFAQGIRGQELPVDIPVEIRERVQRVIFRVGTGPVERNPPNLQNLSSARNTNLAPHLATLDNRSPLNSGMPVSIDPPRFTEYIPTSATGSQLNSPPAANASPPVINTPNLNSPSNLEAPWNSSQNRLGDPSNFDASGRLIASNNNQNYGAAPSGAGATNHGDIVPNAQIVPPSNGTQNNRYPALNTARPNSALDILRPNTTTGSSANQIPYGNPSNSTTYNRNDPTTYVATTPNALPTQPNFNNPAWPAGQSNNPPPTYQQGTYPVSPTQQQYNAPPPVQLSPYSGASSPSLLAGNTLPAFSNSGQTPIQTVTPPELTAAPKDKLLPFLLLFSIVGNVYLALWMGHLREHHRRLLGTKRGIPAADLDD